jgi:rhodanese-related sulfurtransferase
MTITSISPNKAQQLIDEGAALVDIREADEHARARIPGAVHLPLSKMEGASDVLEAGRTVIFHCKSGARTGGNATRLAQAAQGCRVHIIDGGLEAWRQAGLPVISDARQPMELQRQVQIVAGSLAAAGALLALLLSPWFAVLPLVVGSGLVFSGVSGSCAMAGMLRHAPWNRHAPGPAC